MPDRTLYDVARSRSVWVERPARGRLWISGADRASYLQGLLTNDIKAIAAGGGCYAAWLTPQGRMITDMRLYEQGDGLLMTLPAATAAAARDRLDALVFAENVTVEAGIPEFGVDMDTDTIPLEAGIEARAISFTKGCYVGQEVIVRVLHRGQ